MALFPSDSIEPGFFRHLLKSRGYIAALQSTSNLVRDGQALRYENFTMPTAVSAYRTGEGKTGDQVMLRGNRVIAEHQADGTALRLFVAVGNRPGSGTRIHQYVGQFAVDPERPYVVRRAPGCQH